jgi:hypothetical protein
MRPTVDSLTPEIFAIEERLQWVSPAGLVSKAMRTISLSLACVINSLGTG